MKLNLRNPLVFLDLETTGINIASDRIVEIALLKIYPDGTEEEKVIRVNPGMPIPEAAVRIHGITDEDVRDAPLFKEVARTLARFLEGCDLAGFNSNRFDIPLLAEEFLRCDVDFDLKKRKFIDVQAIYHKMEKRTLAAAYKLYCNKELVDAHSALADTRATYEVLKAQLDTYQDVEYEDQNGRISIPVVNDVAKLSEFSAYDRYVDYMGRIVLDENGVEIFNFGKNKGLPVEKVLREQPGYYSWMLNGDFPLYTKKVLTQIKLRMKER
ncbi:MAG: 3'-5' exonuclease [Prolixibacteraceae bacterium]|mgnify:CR=1 FL=1|jgi:DNA polymerase-3 subunit epsilon|nr:3'-5' exonuclease [Prolixibacteraceae bacterium]MDI9563272.1 3'-5' exonuclease [Bacteroidota bacterium]NLS99354.1 3'-5' exonuclease [Bacteroidales bacterium]OQB79031.1 MAG: DNA polymerase III PolC-type [Bacteroidetes bacterium ADurb.Bin123]HNZ68612.1 3'-5' exonuclease [Prolixibacteraceae bacterium]